MLFKEDVEFKEDIELCKIANYVNYLLSIHNKQKIIIGISGGVESTAALYILKKVIGRDNIICVAAPFGVDPEYAAAQKVAFLAGVDFFAFNIRKSVEKTELLFKEALGKDYLGDKVDSNVCERNRYNTLAMTADYYNGIICLTTSMTKAFINDTPYYSEKDTVMSPFINYTRTELIQLAIAAGCPSSLFREEVSLLERKLGFPLSMLDDFIRGASIENPRILERIELLHNKTTSL